MSVYMLLGFEAGFAEVEAAAGLAGVVTDGEVARACTAAEELGAVRG